MVEIARANRGIDLRAERAQVGKFGQTVEIVEGVPVYYSQSGEPAAESDNVPAEEVARRGHLVFRANVMRWLDK